MLKKKEQTMRVNYIVVLSMQDAHPYFEWFVSLDTGDIFSRKQMEIRQENVDF